jgi:hypothetical protein
MLYYRHLSDSICSGLRKAPVDVTNLWDAMVEVILPVPLPLSPANYPTEVITEVISLQLGNCAMAESMVQGFSLGVTPALYNSRPLCPAQRAS